MKAPKLQKKIPARKPCVTDVLCNWELAAEIPGYPAKTVLIGGVLGLEWKGLRENTQ